MVTDGSLATPDPPASGPGQPPRDGRPGLKVHGRPRAGWLVRHGMKAAKEKYPGSAAEDLWHRLNALDFMNQAMLLAGTFLLCVFPLLIVLSAVAGPGAATGFSRRLGLNKQAAADMGHLFSSKVTTSATITTATFVLLGLFAVAGATAIQQLYERIFDLDSRGARDMLRRLIWAALVVGWLALGDLVGPALRAGGPVLFGIIILVAFTGFWWFAMRFLLSARIPWRRLFPSALATGLCWLGMVAVFSTTFSGMVISSYDRYGPIGIVFDLLSYGLAIGVVVILGAVVGIVWHERRLPSRGRPQEGPAGPVTTAPPRG
jgi:membrane protein